MKNQTAGNQPTGFNISFFTFHASSKELSRRNYKKKGILLFLLAVDSFVFIKKTLYNANVSIS